MSELLSFKPNNNDCDFDRIGQMQYAMNNRSCDAFIISEDTKKRLLNLREFWDGKTHKDEVLRNLSPINILAEKQDVLHRGGYPLFSTLMPEAQDAIIARTEFGW